MTDTGNAVTAKWVGPAGMQLWTGQTLTPGDIVPLVGYDEANGSPYWEIVKPEVAPSKAKGDS